MVDNPLKKKKYDVMPDLLKNSINFVRPRIDSLTFLAILDSLEKSIHTSEKSDILSQQ